MDPHRFPTTLHCTVGTGLLNSQRSRGRYLLSKTVNPADPKSKTLQQAALGKQHFIIFFVMSGKYNYLCAR